MATSNPIYILDTNVFIEAKKRYYAFDIIPSFWQSLINHAKTGRIQSIDRVKAEIDEGEDALSTWVNSDFHTWFISTDKDEVNDAYRRVIEWAYNQTQFNDYAKNEFSGAKNADAWLIAFALSNGYTLVTEEKQSDHSIKRIPIPNVCQEFGIQFLDTFEMLRRLQVKI